MLTNKTLLNSCFMKSQQLEKLSINNLVKFRLSLFLEILVSKDHKTRNKCICLYHFKKNLSFQPMILKTLLGTCLQQVGL